MSVFFSKAKRLSVNLVVFPAAASRRQPLDERYVTKFLTQLDHLYHVFDILRGRIAFVLSPKATDAHALPAPFEQERKYMCVFFGSYPPSKSLLLF